MSAADSPSLETFTRALPEHFSFYHMGEVDLDSDPQPALGFLERENEDLQAIAFSIEGEPRGLLVVAFDQGLDPSTYSEMGNILASQLANRLSAESGSPFMISPPRVLSERQLSLLAKSVAAGASCLTRLYWHRFGKLMIPLHAILLLTEPEGLGNA